MYLCSYKIKFSTCRLIVISIKNIIPGLTSLSGIIKFPPSIVSFPLVYKQAVNSSNLKNNKNKISIIYNPLQYFLAPFCSKTPQRSSLSILLSMSLYTHFLPFLKSMDLLSDYTHLTVISSSSMTLN